MHRLIRISSIAIFAFSLAVSSVAAQTPTTTTDGSLIRVASVNIEDPKIISQNGNTFDVSFAITNRDGVQSGVKYGVLLVKTAGNRQSIADAHTYDDSLTLVAGSRVEKTVSYTAPASLSGNYTLMLTSQNGSGFPFAQVSVGEVTLVSNGGVELLADTCMVNGVQPNSIVEISEGKALTLSCAAINRASSAVSAQPTVTTFLRSEYGQKMEVSGAIAPITFAAGERKSLTITIPTATAPQVYFATVSLSANNAEGNGVAVRYVIPGAIATIVNASLDKDYYERNDVAIVKLIWQGNGIKGLPTLTTEMTNGEGKACSKIIDRPLMQGSRSGTIEAYVSVTADCYDPQLTLTVKDAAGNVLDEKQFSVKTASVPEGGASRTTAVLIIAGIVIVLFAIYILRKRRGNVPPPATIALFAFALIAGYNLLTASPASADTFVLKNNSNVYVTVTAPTSFAPGDEIAIQGRIESHSSQVSDVYLDGTIAGQTKKIVDYGTLSGAGIVSGSVSFTAGSPGSSTMRIKAGENVIPLPSTSFSFAWAGVGWTENGTQGAEMGVCLNGALAGSNPVSYNITGYFHEHGNPYGYNQSRSGYLTINPGETCSATPYVQELWPSEIYYQSAGMSTCLDNAAGVHGPNLDPTNFGYSC